jgi:hypothetical protein
MKTQAGEEMHMFKKIRLTQPDDFDWLLNFNLNYLLSEDDAVACPGMYWKCSNQSLSVPYYLDSLLTYYKTAFVVQKSSFLRISTAPGFTCA